MDSSRRKVMVLLVMDNSSKATKVMDSQAPIHPGKNRIHLSSIVSADSLWKHCVEVECSNGFLVLDMDKTNLTVSRALMASRALMVKARTGSSLKEAMEGAMMVINNSFFCPFF